MDSDIISVKKDLEKNLKYILEKNEEWLMERVLYYAIKQGYSAYTSTLKEAWRLSISGLSASIIGGIGWYNGKTPEITPEENFTNDPVAVFGMTEARKHRERGVSLSMFMGLLKYYRQSYIDLIQHQTPSTDTQESYGLFINRIFDRIEISFCVGWSGLSSNSVIHELQNNNLVMTNEKNKYLTIFESIPNPVILIDSEQKIEAMNFAAARLLKNSLIPGSQYYFISTESQSDTEQSLDGCEDTSNTFHAGDKTLCDLLPWIKCEFEQFHREQLDSMSFEKQIENKAGKFIFQIKFSRILDISRKFNGTIAILQDITALKIALEEINALRGIIPICMYCKNIRADEGFWQKVEHYIADHSEAQFSHGICPECLKKYHPESL